MCNGENTGTNIFVLCLKYKRESLQKTVDKRLKRMKQSKSAQNLDEQEFAKPPQTQSEDKTKTKPIETTDEINLAPPSIFSHMNTKYKIELKKIFQHHRGKKSVLDKPSSFDDYESRSKSMSVTEFTGVKFQIQTVKKK